jgi:hypothetical protein
MSHPIAAPRPWRIWLLGAALAVALFGLAAQQAQPGQGLGALPLYDFVEYWAAGRLLAGGENPYDPVRMDELERQAGRTEEAILMWSPPWALALVAPLGLLDVRTAHQLWLLFHLVVLLGCADVLWRHFGGPDNLRWLSWLVALTFIPTGMALLAGQISPLLLLGAAGFLVCARRRWDVLAGAFTVLLAIKPHLTYLFWIALLPWAVVSRRWLLLLGGAGTGVALTAVAVALDPGVLGHYWHTFTQSPPAQYRSPTLGTLLRLIAGEGHFRWQFVAMVPGGVWLAWRGWRRRRDWDWDEQLPLLLLVSMLTAAYGAWPFDLVLLLVPVLRTAVLLRGSPRLRIVAGAVFVAITALALGLVAREAEYLWFIWMTPALLVSCAALGAAARSTVAASLELADADWGENGKLQTCRHSEGDTSASIKARSGTSASPCASAPPRSR